MRRGVLFWCCWVEERRLLFFYYNGPEGENPPPDLSRQCDSLWAGLMIVNQNCFFISTGPIAFWDAPAAGCQPEERLRMSAVFPGGENPPPDLPRQRDSLWAG